MNSLKKQLENLIISNVPKNIDLRLPVSEDTELKAILNDILSIVKDTNKNVKSCYIRLYELTREMEISRNGWYRG